MFKKLIESIYNRKRIVIVLGVFCLLGIGFVALGQEGRSCSMSGDDCISIDVIIFANDLDAVQKFFDEFSSDLRHKIPFDKIELISRSNKVNRIANGGNPYIPNANYVLNNSSQLQRPPIFLAEEIDLHTSCNFYYELRIRLSENPYDEDAHRTLANEVEEFITLRDYHEKYSLITSVISPETVGLTDTLSSINSTGFEGIRSNLVQNQKSIQTVSNHSHSERVYLAILDTGVTADRENDYKDVKGFILEDEGNPIDNYNNGQLHGQPIIDIVTRNPFISEENILAYKVCNDAGQCHLGDVIAGICEAIRVVSESNSNAQDLSNLVLAFSMNSSISNLLLENMFQEVLARGANIVTSNGNLQNHSECSQYNYCEVFPSVLARDDARIISVGAIDENGNVWDENIEDCGDTIQCSPEFYAPGVDIRMYNTTYSGTSFASPLVAGIVAHMKIEGYESSDIESQLLHFIGEDRYFDRYNQAYNGMFRVQ